MKNGQQKNKGQIRQQSRVNLKYQQETMNEKYNQDIQNGKHQKKNSLLKDISNQKMFDVKKLSKTSPNKQMQKLKEQIKIREEAKKNFSKGVNKDNQFFSLQDNKKKLIEIRIRMRMSKLNQDHFIFKIKVSPNTSFHTIQKYLKSQKLIQNPNRQINLNSDHRKLQNTNNSIQGCTNQTKNRTLKTLFYLQKQQIDKQRKVKHYQKLSSSDCIIDCIYQWVQCEFVPKQQISSQECCQVM